VLGAAEPVDKVRLTREAAQRWRAGTLAAIAADQAPPAGRPARPARPELRPPREMAKRGRAHGLRGRVALLHALAHIELNAIDLAWDLLVRFAGEALPVGFQDDWVTVADDEARHFELLAARLADFGAAYGDLPAHDGLWQAADATAHDLAARLAVVPMVLEARALDVTPATVDALRAAGDEETAALLGQIFEDEIGHVAAGRRWFEVLCQRRGVEPVPTWHTLVGRHFKGSLKPPFNDAGRARAGFSPDYYRNFPPQPAASGSVA
jgi:uncharacterized ferritin-like protein (DUF455 family)